MGKLKSLVVAAGILLPAVPAWSVPQILNYQGRLSDSGIPVTGNRDITFSIFDAATAGTLLFSEAHAGSNSVYVSSGTFNVLLGTLTSGGVPLSVFDGSDKYIEVNVGGTILPRQRMTSVGYAFHSAFADQSSTAAYAQVAGSIAGGTASVNVSTMTANAVNASTLTVANISIATGTIQITSGGMKIGHSIILGPVSGTLGANNTISFENGAGYINTVDPGAGPLTLGTADAFPIILNPGGNVGIGTPNPETSLHVAAGGITSGQASTVTGSLKLYNSASPNATVIQASNATAAVVYKLPPADGSPGQVLTTDGNGNLSWATVVFPPPSIASISPVSGSNLGGTIVTITGTNFRTNATVTFGGTFAPTVTVIGSTQLQVNTPAGPSTGGTVDVLVRNPDGQAATLVGGYSYTVAATPACANGSVQEQVFVPGSMVGCTTNPLALVSNPGAGAALCASGWHLCDLSEYAARIGTAVPTRTRWLTATAAGYSQGYVNFFPGGGTYCQTPNTNNNIGVPVTYNLDPTSKCWIGPGCSGTPIPYCFMDQPPSGMTAGATCCK